MKEKTGCIYMLQNKVNSKMYIGKTMRRLETRIERHLKDTKYGSELAIHRAIRKYGIDNFEIKVLEDGIKEENLSEKEIYYIKKYDSTHKGYNLSKGGKGGKITKYSDEQIYNVKCLLRDTELTSIEIAKKTGVSVHMVRDINRGKSLSTDDFPIPIREIKAAKRLNDMQIKEIKILLLSAEYKLSQIAKKYECSINTISRINSGKEHFDETLTYPLMPVDSIKSGCHLKEDVLKIIDLLYNTEIPLKDISEKTGFPIHDVWDINNGHTWKNLWDKDYPIRKYNWKTLEDIDITIDLIMNSTLSCNEICSKVGISSLTYYSILNGTHKFCKDKNLEFPLERKKIKEITEKKVLKIIDLYVMQDKSMYQIHKETGINSEFIKGVINGTSPCMRDKKLNFPLIRGSQKV